VSAISSPTQARILIVGKGQSGKTSLVRCLLQGHTSELYTPTIGCRLYETQIDEERTNSKFHVFLWDTSGSHDYAIINRKYYKGSSGAIITCCSREVRDNFPGAVTIFVEAIRRDCGSIPIVIAVTKSDVSDETDACARPQKFRHNSEEIPIIYISSRTGSNVLRLFIRLLFEIVRHEQLVGERIDTPIHTLEDLTRTQYSYSATIFPYHLFLV